MKGDISRDTFRKENHYDSVRAQQGRGMLDPDLNEQVDIERYHAETKAEDNIGISGAPLDCSGFHIITKRDELTSREKKIPGNDQEFIDDWEKRIKLPGNTIQNLNFFISAGRFYIDGILCENEKITSYLNQADLPSLSAQNVIISPDIINRKPEISPFSVRGIRYLVYLDCWKRHISVIEDPSIREVALGGPDTATRVKVVWQVKVKNLEGKKYPLSSFRNYRTSEEWTTIRNELGRAQKGSLYAKIKTRDPSDNPCDDIISLGYSGQQNQLYRVEIHKGGSAGTYDTPTFKWSRENGAVTSRCELKNGSWKLITPTKDADHGFSDKDWVEITDDAHELWEIPGQLVKIKKIDPLEFISVGDLSEFTSPKLRRWDQSDITSLYDEKSGIIGNITSNNTGISIFPDAWYELENNILIKFEKGKEYRTGDYWLIPARTLKPKDLEGWIKGEAQLPKGPEHHYCPLSILDLNDDSLSPLITDCRPVFPPTSEQVHLYKVNGDGQEAFLDPGDNNEWIDFPLPLTVSVANGRWPAGVSSITQVTFSVTTPGILTPEKDSPKTTRYPPDIPTDENGVAQCWLHVPKDQCDKSNPTTTITIRATIKDNYGDTYDDLDYRPGQVFTATIHVINASLVSYSPSQECPRLTDVTTVQEALDTLCVKPDTMCTVIVNPQAWVKCDGTLENYMEKTKQQITQRTGAKFCFQAGIYELKDNTPLEFTGIHNLMICGCGPATRIIAHKSKSVLIIKDCDSVSITDLYAESDLANINHEKPHLNGTLTIYRCPQVSIERIDLKCASGNARATSCINIRDAPDPVPPGYVKPITSVRVRDCNLFVGHQQVGIILTNVIRSDLVNNHIITYDRPAELDFKQLFKNIGYSRNFCRQYISLQSSNSPPEATNKTSNMTIDNFSIPLTESMISAMKTVIEKVIPRNYPNEQRALELTRIKTSNVLSKGWKNSNEEIFSGEYNLYNELNVAYENKAAGSQGIVISGTVARDVTIQNSIIEGFFQGIHIGVGFYKQIKENAEKYPHYYPESVHISDNQIIIRLLPGIGDRHGIYTCNCRDQIITKNKITIHRPLTMKKRESGKRSVNSSLTDKIQANGIEICGYFGDMMIIEENHIFNINSEINVDMRSLIKIKLLERKEQPLWLITNNLSSRTLTSIASDEYPFVNVGKEEKISKMKFFTGLDNNFPKQIN